MSKREDRIREAASLHVKIGQLQRYCELMVELGEVTVTSEIGNLKQRRPWATNGNREMNVSFWAHFNATTPSLASYQNRNFLVWGDERKKKRPKRVLKSRLTSVTEKCLCLSSLVIYRGNLRSYV